MKLYLGIDGGQSGTTALVGDEAGRIVGIGRGGPCNPVSNCEAALEQCVREAASEASFECACFGFSGGFENKEAIARRIVRAKNYVFAHDALIALAGAAAGEPGIVVIAGTGSMAYGRNAEGRTARAGGWGFAFGDEGGAFDIVRQSLRAALRFEEGWGPPTALRDALLSATGASGANNLLHRFYTDEFPRARIAALAKIVDETAQSDAIAKDILNGAAQSLAMYASAVRSTLFKAGEPAIVSHIGGVFRSRAVLARFQTLMELEESNRVQPPRFGPAAGALMEAYRSSGLSVQLKDAPVEKRDS